MAVLQTTAEESGAESVADVVWFGDPGRPLIGWLTRPPGGTAVGCSGIVIAQPIGYEYWCGHRSLRTLATRLAAAGHSVLRFDYDGTGDSAGDQWEEGRVDAWRRSLALAVGHLRGLGLDQITLVGARLGATLALLDAAALNADRVVAWLPVASGRRFVKELKYMSTEVPEEHDPLAPAGTRTYAGCVFSATTLDDLRRLDVTALSEPPARAALVIDDPTGSVQVAAAHLRSLGGDVTHLQFDGSEESLRTPPEFAIVPAPILDAICDWIGPAPDAPDAPDAPAARPPDHPDAAGRAVELAWRGGTVTETVLRLPGPGHVAVLTAPAAGDPEPTTLVQLNTGSETHVGPGRAWVEMARDLALTGRRSVRVDYLGWGESPDAGRAPGRPYDACCEQDTVAIVEALREAGIDRVALCGLCASAWIAMRVATQARPAGLVALNPQLYWQRGDPVEIDREQVLWRRRFKNRRIERGARVGLWSLLDVLGHRPPQARWLDELAASGIPVHLVFAGGDDGLVYLRRRFGRRLDRVTRRGAVVVREVPDVDHPMHLTWMRPRLAQAIGDVLHDIDRR